MNTRISAMLVIATASVGTACSGSADTARGNGAEATGGKPIGTGGMVSSGTASSGGQVGKRGGGGATSVVPDTAGASGNAAGGHSSDPTDAGGTAGIVSTAGTAGTASTASTAGAAGTTTIPTPVTPCAGLEGEWTAQLTVDVFDRTPPAWPSTLPPITYCWIGANGPEGGMPSVAPAQLGLALSATDGKCSVKLLPEFGVEIVHEMLPTADGLTLPPNPNSTIQWCHPAQWWLTKLSIVASTAPKLSVESYVVGPCDDLYFFGTARLSAVMTQGLFAQALRVQDTSIVGPNCSAKTTSADAPLGVLPWHSVSVTSALPVLNPMNSLSASVSWQDVAVPWPLPNDWSAIMGKTLKVSLLAQPAATTYLDVVKPPLLTAFEGEALAQMTTRGAGGIETVGARTALHLTGKSCWNPVWAAGRLQVAGKQSVVFELERIGHDPMNTDAPTLITANAIDPGGAALVTQWTKVAGSNVRLGRVTLNGQSEVGVEVQSVGGCRPMTALDPDLRIFAIRTE